MNEFRRNDDRDRLADHFFGAVPEKPDGALVPRIDMAVERLADDRVIGRFDDGREQRPAAIGAVFGVAQRGLGAFLVGDITGEAPRVGKRAVFPADIRCHQHVAYRAVLAAHARGLVG